MNNVKPLQESAKSDFKRIDNRYILGDCLFSGELGTLYRARDAHPSSENDSQVLIHFFPPRALAYTRLRQQYETLKQACKIANAPVLPVRDCSWSGTKALFVLEVPQSWSLSVLPVMKPHATSLHTKALQLTHNLVNQGLVERGLPSQAFLVTPEGELYIPSTLLSPALQNLQKNDLGLLIPNSRFMQAPSLRRLPSIGLLWLGLGGLALASGAGLMYLVVSSTSNTSNEQINTPALAIPELSKPALHLPIDSNRVMLQTALPENQEAKPNVVEDSIVATPDNSEISDVAENLLPNDNEVTETSAEATSNEKITLSPASAPLAEETPIDVSSSPSNTALLNLQEESPVAAETKTKSTPTIPAQTTIRTTPQSVQNSPKPPTPPPFNRTVVANTANNQRALIPNATPTPKPSPVPVRKPRETVPVARQSAIHSGSDDLSQSSPSKPKQPLARPAKPTPRQPSPHPPTALPQTDKLQLKANGMNSNELIRRAYSAVQAGRLDETPHRGAIFYIRLLNRIDRHNPQVMRLARDVVSHYHQRSRESMKHGKLEQATTEIWMSKRIIKEFNLIKLNPAQEVLEHKLANEKKQAAS
ncbi:MAG: hypothetical protein CR991_07765 [Proteobacteria bacterium]|nr:MAG: hypothetical protein CR991_07765 [Pseudomonadota bacterium]